MDIHSEKWVVRGFCHCCKHCRRHLYKARQYSLLHTSAIWSTLLLLGYRPIQHVIELNSVGNRECTVTTLEQLLCH